MKNNAKKFPLPEADVWFRLPEKVSQIYEELQLLEQTPISSPIKTAQVTITESEILNVLGFSKKLVDSIEGKVLVPVSISAYRKQGGTAYSIANSVRLFSTNGSSSSSVGNGTLDAVFQSGTESTTIAPVSTANTSITLGNSLYIASGALTIPSVITGGTGDLIVFITYTEISI